MFRLPRSLLKIKLQDMGTFYFHLIKPIMKIYTSSILNILVKQTEKKSYSCHQLTNTEALRLLRILYPFQLPINPLSLRLLVHIEKRSYKLFSIVLTSGRLKSFSRFTSLHEVHTIRSLMTFARIYIRMILNLTGKAGLLFQEGHFI